MTTPIFKVWPDINFAAEAVPGNDGYFANVRVWHLMGVQPDGTVLYTREPHGSPEPTEDREEADVYLHGHIKWDGCANLHFDEQDRVMLHFCGLRGAKAAGTLLERLYELAGEAMPQHAHEFLPGR